MPQIGETQDAGFEIGVSRTVPFPRAVVWDFLASPGGQAVWLGPGAALVPQRGQRYRTADGTTGEVRSYRELDRIRLTMRPAGWDHDTTVQVTVSGAGRARHRAAVPPGMARRRGRAGAAARALARDHGPGGGGPEQRRPDAGVVWTKERSDAGGRRLKCVGAARAE